MILNVLRMLADWCADGTHGVNARIAGVPRDGGDPEPPPLAAIYDPTRSPGGWVARLEVPQGLTLPALAILQYQDALFEDGVATEVFRGEEIPIALVYLGKDKDSAVAARNGLYTMRAVQRAVHALIKPGADSDPARVRNSITITALSRIAQPRIIAPLEHTTITLAYFVGVDAEDQAP